MILIGADVIREYMRTYANLCELMRIYEIQRFISRDSYVIAYRRTCVDGKICVVGLRGEPRTYKHLPLLA